MRKGVMRLAALVMLAIAGLHLVSLMLAGPLAAGLAGALPAVAAVAVAAGLWRGWRWVAWLAMLGAIVAFGAVLGRVGVSPVPDGVLYLLAIAYGAFSVMSFTLLWWGPRARRAR